MMRPDGGCRGQSPLLRHIASGSFGRVDAISEDVVEKVIGLVDAVTGEVRYNNVREMLLYSAGIVGDPDASVSVSDGGLSCRIRMARHPSTIAAFAKRCTPRQRLAAFDILLDGASEELDRLHRAGVVHNDVKPENIMVTVDGAIRVIDFGSCTLAGRSAPMGFTCSTFPYAPPEAFVISTRDETLPARDAYMLGVTLLTFLNGGVMPTPLRDAHRGAPREVEAAMRHYGRLHFHTDALRADALIDDVRRACFDDAELAGPAREAMRKVAALLSRGLRPPHPPLSTVYAARPQSTDGPPTSTVGPVGAAGAVRAVGTSGMSGMSGTSGTSGTSPSMGVQAALPPLAEMVSAARRELGRGGMLPRPDVVGRVGALAHHLLRQYHAATGRSGSAASRDACVVIASSVLVEHPMRCSVAARREIGAFLEAVPRPDLTSSIDWRLVSQHGMRYDQIDFLELSASIVEADGSDLEAMSRYFSRLLGRVAEPPCNPP